MPTPEGRLKHVRLVLEDGWTQAPPRNDSKSPGTRYRDGSAASGPGLVRPGRQVKASEKVANADGPAHGTANYRVALQPPLGPHRFEYHLCQPQSTVSKVLNRYRMPVLAHWT